MAKRINIAIDGYSSCGKSTLTKALANALDYDYVDTGAMYRAVTYYFIDNNIDLDGEECVQDALQKLDLDIDVIDGQTIVKINGNDITTIIRSMAVSSLVSEVAAISAVRRYLVNYQRIMAKRKGVVMDGRDIGTVVLPDAELKLFMMADKAVRIDRRYNELVAKGVEISKHEVKSNIEKRDRIDTSRADSPLSKAADAILLDNTHLTKEQQLEFVLNLVKNKIDV